MNVVESTVVGETRVDESRVVITVVGKKVFVSTAVIAIIVTSVGATEVVKT